MTGRNAEIRRVEKGYMGLEKHKVYAKTKACSVLCLVELALPIASPLQRLKGRFLLLPLCRRAQQAGRVHNLWRAKRKKKYEFYFFLLFFFPFIEGSEGERRANSVEQVEDNRKERTTVGGARITETPFFHFFSFFLYP